MAYTEVRIETPGQTTPIALRRFVDGGAIVPGTLQTTVEGLGLVIVPVGPAQPDPMRTAPSVILDLVESHTADEPTGEEVTGAIRDFVMARAKDLPGIAMARNPAMHARDVREAVAEFRARFAFSLEDAIACTVPRLSFAYDADDVRQMIAAKPLRSPLQWGCDLASTRALRDQTLADAQRDKAQRAAAEAEKKRMNDKTLEQLGLHAFEAIDQALVRDLALVSDPTGISGLFRAPPSITAGHLKVWLVPVGEYPFAPTPGEHGHLKLLAPSTVIAANAHALQVARRYKGHFAVAALRLFRRWDAGPVVETFTDLDFKGRKVVFLARKHVREVIAGESLVRPSQDLRTLTARFRENANSSLAHLRGIDPRIRVMHGFLKANASAAELLVRAYRIDRAMIADMLIDAGAELAAERGIEFPVGGYVAEEIDAWLERFAVGGEHVSCSPGELVRELTDSELDELLRDNPAHDPIVRAVEPLLEREAITSEDITEAVRAAGHRLINGERAWGRIKSFFLGRGWRKNEHTQINGKRTSAWVPSKSNTPSAEG